MTHGSTQEIIDTLKTKFIRHAINYNGSFILLTSKDYDRDIDIIHAEDESFEACFLRKIEPNLM